MNTDPIVIVGLARTPMGAFQGELKGFAAADLGAAAIRAAVERATIKPEEVDEVIMGCVLPRRETPMRSAKRPFTRSTAHVPRGFGDLHGT